MHTSRLLSLLYVAFSLVGTAVLAEPTRYDGITLPVQNLHPRQTDESTPTRRPTADADSEDEKPAETKNAKEDEGDGEEDEEPSETKKSSGKATITSDEDEPKETGKDSKKSTTTSRTRRIGIHDPAGGISLIEPKTTEGALYYKFGQKITFRYNMTSVQRSPTAVNVEAHCTGNNHYYTIAANMSASETQVVWDTKKDVNAAVPLMQDSYQLYIYDASKPRDAIPSPGYLGTFSNLRFVLYEPRKAMSNEEFTCAGCNSASPLLASGSVRALMIMSFISIASFMWFINGVGL